MSRRAPLQQQNVHTGTHAGLWLDKYLNGERAETERKHDLVQQVCDLAVPHALYLAAYNRWRASLRELRPATEQWAVRAWRYRVASRMVVGLGHEGVLETSISLHRSYGTPLIPGSALKGLAAAYARQRLAGANYVKPEPLRPAGDGSDRNQRTIRDDPYTLLFGSGEQAGYVTFFDAWFVPASGYGDRPDRPLWPDVLTPHHSRYYMGGEAPTEWENPIPQPFLTTTGEYLIALAGPGSLVTNAQLILTWALRDMGIGAKTSSGYGRMTLLQEDNLGAVAIPASPIQSPQLGEGPGPQPAGDRAAPAAEGRREGRIKALPPARSFGFIAPDGGRADIFFVRKDHAAELPVGTRVSFRPTEGEKGPRAEDVRPL